MTQYDNEFFRGPPEGSPTLATDQRPTGVEIFQAKPEKTTAVADTPVTREEAPKDPPKKKSNARRITKAIKLLASCMAAVVITEAAVNIAATIEPPAEVPTGAYYAGQWPGVEPVHDGIYSMNMDSDMGYSIQVPVADQVWRLTAPDNWRMCWYEGVYQVYMGLYDRDTDVFLMADLTPEPFYTDYEEDSYTTVTTSTGETLYIRAFFMNLGKYGEEYGLSEEMMAASAELRQALVDDIFAGIEVTPGTADGWQGFQIGDKIYSQQGPEWYGLGGFGDLDIYIPWVNYAADYNLHNMTPYSRVNVNGITWSIYFAENDTYLWAVPNIDPEICLGGLTARFMCADAVRRGEYINDEEWLEMGGFTSASQRQTAVDIMIECLQHHYALAEGTKESMWPEWPRIDAVDFDASLSFEAASQRGTSVQFSFGDRAYRINSDDPSLRFYWETTYDGMTSRRVHLAVVSVDENSRNWGMGLTIQRAPFPAEDDIDEGYYAEMPDTDGEMMYLRFNSYWADDVLQYSPEALKAIADKIMASIQIHPNPDDSGWGRVLICDTMYSPQSMYWSGRGMVTDSFSFDYIHTVEYEGLQDEMPCEVRTVNGITWSFYYDEEDSVIWAQPDIEPDVCIGGWIDNMHYYYRKNHPNAVTGGWNVQYDVPYDDVNHAVEGLCEALAYIYPLGAEPEEGWYIPDWPMIGQTSMAYDYNLMDYSRYGTFAQFSLGDVSYRLDSGNSHLNFFWNETAEEDGVMQANLYINHMTNKRRDWRVELFLQKEPFAEPRDEDNEIDATVPVSDGTYLYLRFRRTWYDGTGEDTYAVFQGWVRTVLDAVTASPADPNGWGQVWICDLMTTPLNKNWDGNAMVTEDYEIPYFNRVEEQGLAELNPYTTWECNGILWTIVYAEEDDIIWGIPDIEARWCIGAPAQAMAAFAAEVDVGDMDVGEYRQAALEGLAAGLSNYYPRQDFEMGPTDDPTDEPLEDEAVWPNLLPVDSDANYGLSYWSNQNTEGIFSLGGTVYQIESHREDLRFWWENGWADMAAVTVYSIPEQGGEQWLVTMWIQEIPFDTYDGDPSCYRTVNLPGNENLYLRFDGGEALADEILSNISFDYSGKEENWHTVCIGNTLQTQQGYDWTGLGMVYQDYYFDYLHNAESVDLHDQDYEGQRTINGILWTFRFHKDNGVLYAYPETEPNLGIGANPDVLWTWYDAQYGALDDYFETLVESMSLGLQQYYLRPGVVIKREPVTGPVVSELEPSNFVQFSLGQRGYYLESDMEQAWLSWYFTEPDNGVMVADLTVGLDRNGGTDYSAKIYIAEDPLTAYDHLNHGMITVGTDDVLYWYCMELHNGDDAQIAEFMGSLTASGARFAAWGRVPIEDRIVSLQSLSWSGWETVEADGGRTVMMWNLERPTELELGAPIAQQKINKVVWTLYITEEYSSEKWPFIWAVPDVDPNIAIGSDYENAVYKYYEDRNMTEDFDGDIWSDESRNGAAEVIFEVLQNYYPT